VIALIAPLAAQSGLSPVDLVGLIGGIFGILSVVAGALAVLKSNYLKATVDTLKESNTALNERNDQLDKDVSSCALRIDALEKENETLRTLASGADAVVKLRETLAIQHAELLYAVTNLHVLQTLPKKAAT
jgi:FtsZ-binding cell division protein ZapB